MHPEKSKDERGIIYRILDEGLLCAVEFNEKEQLYNIPMTYVRIGDSLFVHSPKKIKLYNHLKSGINTCATVTLIDGVRLAKTAFNSSMNYRSAVIFGMMWPLAEKLIE